MEIRRISTQPDEPIASPDPSRLSDQALRDRIINNPPDSQQPPITPDSSNRNSVNWGDIAISAAGIATAAGIIAAENAKPGIVKETIKEFRNTPREKLAGIGETVIYAPKEIIGGTGEIIVDLGQYAIRGPVRALTQQSGWACLSNECQITLQTSEPPPPQPLVAGEAVVGAVAFALAIKAIAGPVLRIGEAIAISRTKK